MSAARFERTYALTDRLVDELCELYAAEWWTKGRTPEDVRRALAGSTAFAAFVERGSGRLAAFARILSDGVYKALVFDVIVARELRGTGLGHALMEAVLDLARGVRHVELYCLPELEPFYARYRFAGTEPLILLRAEGARAAPSA